MQALLAIATLGRPVAGKTALARFVATTLGLQYIPEAAIKRCLRPEYVTRDSLDEALRDLGYRAAIEVARACLEAGAPALVDAAFHRRHRRRWLYDAVAKTAAGLVLLYCRCDDPAKVAHRIELRARGPKTAETQADSMEVHRAIDAAFEEPEPDEFPADLPVAIFDVDTHRNACPPPRIIGRFREADQPALQRLADLVRDRLAACRAWPT
jgi:predicted kinase